MQPVTESQQNRCVVQRMQTRNSALEGQSKTSGIDDLLTHLARKRNKNNLVEGMHNHVINRLPLCLNFVISLQSISGKLS
jgi:hypothetical protein